MDARSLPFEMSSVECGRRLDNDQLIAEHNDLNRELVDRRREVILKDFENSFRLYEVDGSFSRQASIEIVSANDFLHPNTLLTLRPRLLIRYKLLKSNNEVILKGETDAVQNSSTIHSTIEFTVQFIVAFVAVIFVSIYYCICYHSSKILQLILNSSCYN